MKSLIYLIFLLVFVGCSSEPKEKKTSEKLNDSIENATNEVSKGVNDFNSGIRGFFDKHKTKSKDSKEVDQQEEQEETTESQ